MLIDAFLFSLPGQSGTARGLPAHLKTGINSHFALKQWALGGF